MFITPYSTPEARQSYKLIRLIENELQKAEKEHPQLVAEYFGGPSGCSVQCTTDKKDTLVTSSIALIIIIVFISEFQSITNRFRYHHPGAVRSFIRLMPHLLYQ